MRLKPTQYVANFDSATAFLRSLSRFLHGKGFPALGSPGGNALLPLVQLVSALPRPLREQIYSWSGWAEAARPGQLSRVSAEAMARWMVGYYPQRRYPAVALGSSGGALVHLCAALGIPWLPQTVLIPVRAHFSPDEPWLALRFGQEKGPLLLEPNPELQLHHMHDAAQDRLMLRHMAYFRVKRRQLGYTFSAYLRQALEPRGMILLVECERRWPTLRVGPRHVFQLGAVGGIEPEEYQRGSPRVEAYLRRYGIPRKRWEAPAPDGDSPEAEWGFEPLLREEVEDFARRHGYRVRRVRYTEPDHLSPLVADLYRWWYRKRGMQARRLVVESFVEQEPWWVLRTGTVPFWMTFNTESSLESLEQYLREAEPYDTLHLMLMQHGTEGPGLASIQQWRELLSRVRQGGHFLGVDPEKHPRDFASFVRYHTELRKLPERHPMPGPLSLGQLEEFLEESGERYPVRWEEAVMPHAARLRSSGEETPGAWTR
jgi:hypothetical protein